MRSFLSIGKFNANTHWTKAVTYQNRPFTPYCNLTIVELVQWHSPPGVVQALNGDDNLGPWLIVQPGVDKISFTGSTATGKKVMYSAAVTLKRVTLEL